MVFRKGRQGGGDFWTVANRREVRVPEFAPEIGKAREVWANELCGDKDIFPARSSAHFSLSDGGALELRNAEIEMHANDSAAFVGFDVGP